MQRCRVEKNNGTVFGSNSFLDCLRYSDGKLLTIGLTNGHSVDVNQKYEYQGQYYLSDNDIRKLILNKVDMKKVNRIFEAMNSYNDAYAIIEARLTKYAKARWESFGYTLTKL